jgi:hypothetical protein
MSADLTKRIMVRVTDEQLAWIGAMATDEGMDNATFVRVVIDRLSKGRAPLIGMMSGQGVAFTPSAQYQPHFEGSAPAGAETNDILAQRAAEAEAAIPQGSEDTEPAQQEHAAIPLRRVQRERYNPGRQ